MMQIPAGVFTMYSIGWLFTAFLAFAWGWFIGFKDGRGTRI